MGTGNMSEFHLWGHFDVRTVGLQDKPHRFSCVNSFCVSVSTGLPVGGEQWFYSSPLKWDTCMDVGPISAMSLLPTVGLCEQGLTGRVEMPWV